MDNEEDTDFVTSEEMNLDADNNLVISGTSSNAEFCMIFDDDVMDDGAPDRTTSASDSKVSADLDDSTNQTANVDLDVEAIKKKADKIASSLKKFRNSRGKSADTSITSQDYEPPEEFKRYHETSQYVAQKLKEDRKLFEESQKRNEATRHSKRSNKDVSKHPPEEQENLDEIYNLKKKVDKLESTVARLQDALEEKDQIISEKQETIKTLSESVSNEYAARLNLLEQSQEEIKRMKNEHAKTIERITASKEEFCNQLQVIRQKYLQVENELKLADFARCRLVNKNAQLKEKIIQLENEKEELNKTYNQEEQRDEEKENQSPTQLSDTKDYIAKNLLHPKLQCVEMIVNEFYSYVIETAMSNSEFADDEGCPEDDDYATKTLEKIGDKLESTFYLAKDKFNSVVELEENLKLSNDKIAELQHLNDENKRQEMKLKKLLATLKAKVQSESNSCKQLSDQLTESKDRIAKLQHKLSNETENWQSKYLELEKINDDISYQLNATREKLLNMEFVDAAPSTHKPSPEDIQTLKSECARLHDENNEIAMLLEMKNRDYDVLMAECETLRKSQEDGSSSDKTENDFVVLRKTDAECEDNKHPEDGWKQKYDNLCEDNDKLMTSIRSMSEKAIEWENEKLTMINYQDQHQRLQNEYQELSQQLQTARHQVEELSVHKAKAQKEIDSLNCKLDALESQLISNEEILQQQTSESDKLKDQLRHARQLNDTLKSELDELREKYAAIDLTKITRNSDTEQFKSAIEALEREKTSLLEECEKFKTKYQRLQVYCKANINKTDKSADAGETEKYRNKCKELLALNKQLQESLNQAQLAKQTDQEDLEKLNAENHSLQVYCTEAKRQIEALKIENAELLELKDSYEDLEASNQRLKEALREAQQNTSLVDELETLKQSNQELQQRLVETAQRVDHLSRENSELRERSTVLNEEHLQRSNYREELDRHRHENQTLNERLAEALSKLDSLTEANTNLTTRLQQSNVEEIRRELEWYRQEYESQKSFYHEACQQIESLTRENAHLKEATDTFNQRFSSICEESRQLRQVVDQMKTENQTLDATNEQLMDFCNKAREQIASLNRTHQDYTNELDTLGSKCAALEEANKRLREDELERLRCENEALICTNDQLTEFCTNAKHKIDQLETMKPMCDELQQTVENLRTTYETELADLREQLMSERPEHEFATNEKLALESQLALACEKIEDYKEQISRNNQTLADSQRELNKARGELKKFRAHVEGVQQDAMDLVAKCTGELDRLNSTVVQLTQENNELREHCHRYDRYVGYYERTCPLMERVRYISEEAYQIVDNLQTQLTTKDEPQKSHTAAQCDVPHMDPKSEKTSVQESTLSLISMELAELKNCADNMEQELREKERILVHYKTTMEEERKRYENLINDLRQNAASESASKYERSLAEFQSNQTHDLERYKALMQEERSNYERVINEMQQNLHHYKSLVDEERAKYERIIFEMQENANKSSTGDVGVYGDERLHYENVIFDYQQKLDSCLRLLEESESRNQPKSSCDFGTQFNTEAIAASPKMDFYDESASHKVSELKLFQAFKPVESVQESVPSVKKYYDYCKDAIKKEIKDILQPEENDVVGEWATEPVGEWATEPVGDWAIEPESEIKLEDVTEIHATSNVGNLIDTLDEVVKRFSNTGFASDYKFDETIEEFPLAFKLAELFQVVVSYYIDSPNSRENPYALELLKKFRDVARQVDDVEEPINPVVVIGAQRGASERFDELVVTARRYEREIKYLHEAVSFFENMVTEYSNFDSELHVAELLHRWRENMVFDTRIPYYELQVIQQEETLFPEKCMHEFDEAFSQWKASNIKRLEIMGVKREIRDSDRPAESILLDVYKILETVKTKLHDLICDLHYVYSSNEFKVNPVEFFSSIEDINHWVEHSLKTILNDESIRQDVSQILADSETEQQHSHDEYDESQSDATSDEKHSHKHHDHERDTVAELKSLLGASNQKIDSLVNELMEVKNSREYAEVRQLHSKLDETMYQLHLRDVHCVELTQELTQLLSERDSLQLKLSTILRQNEQLREANKADRTYEDSKKQPSNLENKLEELQQVNYMKDPRISEPSRLHHASQMQLFSDDGTESSQRGKENKDSGGFSVPSLFKWITGDTEDN